MTGVIYHWTVANPVHWFLERLFAITLASSLPIWFCSFFTASRQMTLQLSLLLAYIFFSCIDNYIFKDPYLCSDLKKTCQIFFWEDGDDIITSGWCYRTCLMDVINRKKLSEVCEHAIMPNKKQTIKLIQRENSFKRALFYDKRKKIELGFILFLLKTRSNTYNTFQISFESN